MWKTIKKYILITFTLIYGTLKIVIQPVILIWNSIPSGSVLFALFFQPILVLVTFAALDKQISVAYMNSNGFLYLIIVFEALFLTFLENTIIELFYHLRGKSDNYDTLQKLQKYFNNYVLLIVSLISLYFGAFPTNNNDANLMLLIIDALYFITTICSDAYSVFIYEKDSVKELAENIKTKTRN